MFKGDPFWLQIWCAHYERLLGGRANLFVIVHGKAEEAQEVLTGTSQIAVPYFANDERFEQRRMRFVHSFAAGLLQYYHSVVFTDTDELLCLHPDAGSDFTDYLAAQDFIGKALSSVGIELLAQEGDPKLDPMKPILQQRSRGIISAGYCKPNVMFQPIVKANQHRIPGEPMVIDRNLLLFHLRYADYDRFKNTARERQAYSAALPQSSRKLGVGGWDDPMAGYASKLATCLAQEPKPLTPANIEPILQRIEKVYDRKGRPGRRSFGHFIVPPGLTVIA